MVNLFRNIEVEKLRNAAIKRVYELHFRGLSKIGMKTYKSADPGDPIYFKFYPLNAMLTGWYFKVVNHNLESKAGYIKDRMGPYKSYDECDLEYKSATRKETLDNDGDMLYHDWKEEVFKSAKAF